MDELTKQQLSDWWRENEEELERLRDLPAGNIDPAAREDEINGEQDEIEYLLGDAYLSEQKLERQRESSREKKNDLGP